MNELSAPYGMDEPPVTVDRIAGILRGYSRVMMLAIAGVGLAYTVAALLIYVLTPSTRIITQRFRLDFPRATEGRYPNGLKFSTSEIITAPILWKVFNQTQLNRFMSFRDFSSAIYIADANPEFDTLQREYQARLSDPRLSAVERQQYERDFADRQAALPRNFYALNFAAPEGMRPVPEAEVVRVLSQILVSWAESAQANGQVTSYDTVVLSPSVVDDPQNRDLVVAIRILINRLSQVLNNLRQISALPSAGLARTKDHLSIVEVEIGIEDLIRFQLEPMVPQARASRGGDAADTLRFVRTQLAFDQRQLQSYQDRVDAIRNAIAVYSNQRGPMEAQPVSAAPHPNENLPTETVMPQLNETFIDRLAKLVNQPADLQYRQKMIDEMRSVLSDMAPVQQAVRYDQELLRDLTAAPPVERADAAHLQVQIDQTRAQAKLLIVKLNEIYAIVSHNLNPETYLYTATFPPTTRVYRQVSAQRLGMVGVIVVVLAVPLIAFFCLLHHRIKEEDNDRIAAARG